MRAMTDQREVEEDWQPADVSPARLGGTDIYRGAIVILAALLIGGFLFYQAIDGDPDGATDTEAIADDDDSVETATADTLDRGTDSADATADGSAAGEEAASDSSTSTVPAAPVPTSTTEAADPLAALRSPAEVRVLMLNGGGAQGIAARGTEMLQAASYTTAAPQNANTNGPSVIYYIDGYEAEAVAVAAVFGPGLDGLVEPLDTTNLPIADAQGAAVIVVIGNDDVIPVA